MLSTIEILLTPICFAFLFALMLLYWGQTAFFSYLKYKKVTSFIFSLSLFCVTTLLILRWVDSGHLPLSNLYESLLFLSWSFLSIQAILQISNTSPVNNIPLSGVPQALVPGEIKLINEFDAKSDLSNLDPDLSAPKNSIHKTTSLKAPIESKDQTEKQELIDLLGVILSPIALLTYTFAFLNLPKEMQKATALVPALQSNWLMMHVSIMILSYAALLSGCILSITYLLFTFVNSQLLYKVQQQQSIDTNYSANRNNSILPSYGKNDKATASALLLDGFSFVEAKNEKAESIDITSKLALSEKLDNYSYRLIGIGFPLLTIGILSGAVWANSAWGSYWSWDPKETWALITWLLFAIYLHARITRGWSGKKAAIIASIAFFAVWFCFLGVNLLGTGLHSYGWFTNSKSS